MKLSSQIAIHFHGLVYPLKTAYLIFDHAFGIRFKAISRRLCRERYINILQVITSSRSMVQVVEINNNMAFCNKNSGGCCLDL